MLQTIIITTLAEGLELSPGIVCRVGHKHSVPDVTEAFKSAASEFVTTPEGRNYQASISGDFNWGDAFAEIPEELLRKHGVLEVEILEPLRGMVIVNHDERLAGFPKMA